MTGMVAPMVLDGPINGDWFEAYVDQVLVPELRPGDIVIMDNPVEPQAHLGARADRGGGAQPCASCRPTAPTSIRSKRRSHVSKAILRKAGERTVNGLWDLIGKLVDIFQPAECANYFSSCGYEPE